MNDMVGRVVLALVSKSNELGGGPHNAEAWVTIARAAIEAMREPTQEMKRTGVLCMPDYDPSVDDAQTCWQSMIDAALERTTADTA